MPSNTDTRFWDELTEKHGHTGYADQTIHRYDQPLRLKAVRTVLRQLQWPNGRTSWSALDIGCGTGDFVHLLLEAGARDVHGVDISPAVAERARRRFANVDRVSVVVGKIQTVLLPAATTDIITSITVLQHILDDVEAEQALAHLRSVLKPNGVLLVLEIAPRKASTSRSSAMIRERSFAEWEQLFSRSGFRNAVAAKPYCPVGFYVVQILIPRALRSMLRRNASSRSAAESHVTAAGNTAGMPAAIAKSVYGGFRRAILAITYPVDYWLGCNLPSRLSYYHLWVLTPTDSTVQGRR